METGHFFAQYADQQGELLQYNAMRRDSYQEVKAMRLDAPRGDLPMEWQAWRLSDLYEPQKISCAPYLVDRIESYVENTQRHLPTIIRDAARNLNSLLLRPAAPVDQYPFFIASSPHYRPCRHAITLQLNISTFDQLGDLRAHLSWADYVYRRLAKRNRRDFPALYDNSPADDSVESEVLEELQVASEMVLASGDDLLLNLSVHGRDYYGVASVEEQIGPHEFRATLYLHDQIEEVPAGTPIFRRLSWMEGDVPKREQVDIGIIHE